MRQNLANWVALSVAWVYSESNGADLLAPSRSGPVALPPRVVEKTREQLRSYFGQTPLNGIPLLDPSVDWNRQANWPGRFIYQGHWYELEITQLSEDGPKPVRVRRLVNPGMTVLFGYRPITGTTGPTLTNAIDPRASWSPRRRAPDKLLFWGDLKFGGTRRTVFDYEFYPEGGLHKFYWQPRTSDEGQWEVFDRNGKLMGLKNSNTCLWNGAKVSPDQFTTLSYNLKRGGGSPTQTPAQPRPPSNPAPPRR